MADPERIIFIARLKGEMDDTIRISTTGHMDDVTLRNSLQRYRRPKEKFVFWYCIVQFILGPTPIIESILVDAIDFQVFSIIKNIAKFVNRNWD